MKVSLIGTGCGNIYSMTVGAVSMLKEADLILGAERLIGSMPPDWGRQRMACIDPEKMISAIEDCAENSMSIDGFGNVNDISVCVAYSGDSGFYSGTRTLLPLLEERNIEVEIIPGISSVQMLSARLGRPWQDWKLVSAHGLECDAAEEVEASRPVFFLTGGRLGPAELCQQLVYAKLGSTPVIIAERLSYEDERIHRGTAVQFVDEDFDSLSVMLVEPVESRSVQAGEADQTEDEFIFATEEIATDEVAADERKLRPGLPDKMFIRGDVPMTKRDVRAIIAGYMQVGEGDVIWDVGSGTGSVSIELALQANRGRVYAIEKDHEGVILTEQNREWFDLDNIEIVEGQAPEALYDLPVPDKVFIGGSDGRMNEIIDVALDKNPGALICVTAILIETAAATLSIMEGRGMEVTMTQIASSSGRGSDGKHMMIGNNPIFVITGVKQ